MRVVMISFHFTQYSYGLALALSETNEVLLLLNEKNAMEELGITASKEVSQNLRIRLIPSRKLRNPLMLLNIFAIVSAVNKFSVDIIHCQESLMDYLILALPLLRKKPLVLTIHDHIDHSGWEGRERLHRRWYKKYLRKIPDALIVHGEVIRQESEKLMPWLKGKVFSIHHGPLGRQKQELSLDWEVGIVLFFGRLEKYKGLKYFLEATRILVEESVEIRAVVAGSGPDLEACREALNNSRITVVNKFIPYQEVDNLFANANVVVMPYTDATQSGVAAYALACGRPIVATRVGALPEMVRDGFNGILVPPMDAKALAEAIKQLLENQEMAQRFARNAFALAHEELSWKTAAAMTEKVYRQAILNKH